MSLQEEFLKELQFDKRYSSNTIVAYKKDLAQFVQYMNELVGDFEFKEVDRKQIRSWVVFLMNSGVKPISINRKLATLKSFYKFLMKYGQVEESPAKLVTVPKIRRKLPVFVQEENLNNLLDFDMFGKITKGPEIRL